MGLRLGCVSTHWRATPSGTLVHGTALVVPLVRDVVVDINKKKLLMAQQNSKPLSGGRGGGAAACVSSGTSEAGCSPAHTPTRTPLPSGAGHPPSRARLPAQPPFFS
eukprot:TRINITY_DN12975_c0_g1_i1.p4 TRINITY_DN12975_c0_g1~~TRINITY_DN12975_c0_g1_i1.p4  ORF type:complete len:107 (+),score=7.92 TRINITY_DN12975_c0_g1_i1:1314-1634(+)